MNCAMLVVCVLAISANCSVYNIGYCYYFKIDARVSKFPRYDMLPQEQYSIYSGGVAVAQW